jgi:hypothetical protein
VEVDAVPAETEVINAGSGAVEDLKRYGVLHVIVMGCGGLKQVVVANVRDNKVIADESDAVGAGR